MAQQNIKVEGKEIALISLHGRDYISLTDISRQVDTRTDIVLSNWLRNAGTLDFLFEWEMLYNEANFKPIKFDGLRSQAGKVGFVMTAKKWIETTEAIGIISKQGKGGGTYAHADIAFEFCSAISARFKLQLIREFQRLKYDEADRLGLTWNLRRELAKTNYPIHTDAVRTNLVPLLDWNTKRESLYFANEADLLNLAVFGATAKQWREANPTAKGNIRDGATEIELHVLANMESANALLIGEGFNKEERFSILSKRSARELEILGSAQNAKKMK
jgi:KilA-N domain